MRVIVTGATGFLGRNLAEQFHAEGLGVLATGRSLEIGDALRQQGIGFEPADLLDLDRLTHTLAPAECVIHCAGRTGDWGRYREFFDANVVGTRNVVKACLRRGIKKIILVSTPSIYFTGRDRLDVRESDPLPAHQATSYARSKLAAEQELTAFQREGGRSIIFRPRALYGPYDTTFVPRILRLAERKHLPLIDSGRALIDITYVGNFVDVVRRSFAAPDRAWNQIYNFSNGDPIRVREWFAQVLAIFDRPFRPKNVPEPLARAVATVKELVAHLPFGPAQPSVTRFMVGYMAKSMTLSLERVREELGYAPRVSSQQGLELFAAWCRSQHQPVSV